MRMVYHNFDPMRSNWAQQPMAAEIRDGAEPVLKATAKRVERIAKANCPVGRETKILKSAKGKAWGERRPGKMRDSIKAHKSRFLDGGWIVVIGGEETYYWTFIEWGAPKHILFGLEGIVFPLGKTNFFQKSFEEGTSVQGLL